MKNYLEQIQVFISSSIQLINLQLQKLTNNKSITQEQLEIKNDYVSYVAKKNDLALKYDYFKTKNTTK